MDICMRWLEGVTIISSALYLFSQTCRSYSSHSLQPRS